MPSMTTTIITIIGSLIPKANIPHVEGFYNSTFGMLKKHGIVPIPKITNNNSNLVIKAKDRTHKGEQTNVIYKIDC